MLGRTSKTRGREDESGLSQPLLNSSEEDLPGSSNGTSLRSNGNVLFSVDDGSDDGSEELLGEGNLDGEVHVGEGKPNHTVRFQEDVQVIAPPLRSTQQSRETGE